MFAMLLEKIKKASFFSRLLFLCILLTVFLVPLLFFPFIRSQFDLPKEIFLYGSLSLIFILSLFEIIQKKTLEQRRTVLDYPFAFLLIFGLITTISSLSPRISLWGRPDTFVLHFFSLFLFVLWTWFLIQKVRSQKQFLQVLSVFFLSGIFSCGIFLFSEFPLFFQWFGLDVFNPIAKLNSIFGIFVVTLFTLAVGVLIPKSKKSLFFTIASIVAMIVSFTSIVRLDFEILWVLVCVGLALLFLLGMAFWDKVRKFFLFVIFGLFLFSLLRIVLPDFLDFGRSLPSEINLNFSLSKDIVESTLTQSTKNFLFGSGPGTFSYDFSLFRPALMNDDAYFWGVRFDSAWSSLLTWVSEFGFVGTLLFFLILLLTLGSVLSAILHIRTIVSKKFSFLDIDSRFEYFVLMIGWTVLTLSLFNSVFNFTLWFVWWTLLALVVVGLAYIQPSLVREHKKTFEIRSQYIFVCSFFFLLLSSSAVIGGVFWGKIFVAEKLMYRAQVNPENSNQMLNEAINFYPYSSQYFVLLARNYFESSVRLGSSQPDEAARLLSLSIEFANRAYALEPKNIRVVEILSSVYLRTLSYTSEQKINSQSVVFATDMLNQAIALEPTNPVFFSQLGMVQEFSGEFDLAQKSYEKAIFLKSNYKEGYFDLSRLYEKQNDLDAAIGIFEHYFSIDPLSPDMLYELGRLLYNRKKTGDESQAEKYWIQSVELEPQFSNALYSLGLLYEKQGKHTLARQYFEQVWLINPENTDIQKKIQGF